MDIQDDCSFRWVKRQGGRMGYLVQKMDRKAMGAIMEELFVRPPRARGAAQIIEGPDIMLQASRCGCFLIKAKPGSYFFFLKRNFYQAGECYREETPIPI